MKKIAVIVAGGTGTRMGAGLPKQFLLLKNKPLLYYTIDTFLRAYDDLDIVLVLPEVYTDMGQEIIDAYFDKDRVRITIGGISRFESVKNGLQLVDDEAIIFVHDAVRCLVSPELIRRCYEQAVETGSAVPVVPSSDSVRLLTEDGSDALDRENVVLVQTPQVFHSKLLIPAFSIEQKGKFTDEASVVEAFGMKVSLVEGEKNNIKITHPIDLVIAEQLLNGNPA
ncbi:2-C-methyl-D-erythritol 4-phosphate cytidylyltransferase [Niabella drilacis]|uniref:2-C-methyl-D-erythritol 4-phosphate cytidylyltransferase n=1 Tax=Niabella drilacis (strain DSM 25811 / CCM 8410 / CCUG 62505 / LMG 26954 / E90) TaxID=1285928 RepID=A0A1G6U5W6_NIADE|nr:2-C-methyl-D-erythritol 4-phosphate cytidylyltransferase [Niabella drilacis]SDD35925.1 2-C-methyl-D-erythritol 4-phosphate cytidylyltransferase [Niabella drilacis]